LEKARFDSKILHFFYNYLIDKKTQYQWNNLTSPYFGVDIGIGQGFVLSPIFSVLYLSLILYIFEKRAKNIEIPVLFLSFVYNSLFISQEKSFENLFCSYNIISSLLE